MADISAPAEDLLNNCKGLTLATLGEDGPLASYAPFIWHQQAIYIFVSTLAPHTRNLQQQRRCSVLLLDESESNNGSNNFARLRMSISATAEFIDHKTPEWANAITQFELRHGKTIHVLAELPDFYLIKLSINHGSLIEGFGKTTYFENSNFKDGVIASGKS